MCLKRCTVIDQKMMSLNIFFCEICGSKCGCTDLWSDSLLVRSASFWRLSHRVSRGRASARFLLVWIHFLLKQLRYQFKLQTQIVTLKTEKEKQIRRVCERETETDRHIQREERGREMDRGIKRKDRDRLRTVRQTNRQMQMKREREMEFYINDIDLKYRKQNFHYKKLQVSLIYF